MYRWIILIVEVHWRQIQVCESSISVTGEWNLSLLWKKPKPPQNPPPRCFHISLYEHPRKREKEKFIVNSYSRRLVNVAPRGTKSTMRGSQRMAKKKSLKFCIHIKQKLASRSGNSYLHMPEFQHKYFFLYICLSPVKYFVLLFCIAAFIQNWYPVK